jgi:hypothetical protein
VQCVTYDRLVKEYHEQFKGKNLLEMPNAVALAKWALKNRHHFPEPEYTGNDIESLSHWIDVEMRRLKLSKDKERINRMASV